MEVATFQYLMEIAPQLVPWAIVLYFMWRLQKDVQRNTSITDRFVSAIESLSTAIDLLKKELHNIQIKQERMEVRHEYLENALTKVEKRAPNIKEAKK